MLHFQVFTSASCPPPSLPSAVRPPLSDPSILHALLTPPSHSRLSPSPCAPFSFSFPLLSHPTLSRSTLYLSLPFFRRDDASLTIARPRRRARRHSRRDAYLRVHRERSPRCLYRDPPPGEEDLFVLRGALPAATVVSPTCTLFLFPSRGRGRGERRERERGRLARSRVHGHTSEIAEVKESPCPPRLTRDPWVTWPPQWRN